MAVKTEAQLNTDIDADITTNGTNDITGAEVNAILSDMVDSSVSRKGSNNTLAFDVLDVASGVNYLSILNAAAAAEPVINAVGTDTDISLRLNPKGAGTVTITSGNIEFNVDSKGIVDASQNELLLFTKTSSAVNYIDIKNEAASVDGGPVITATGSDTNVDMTLAGKGTADIHLDFDNIKWGLSGTAGTVRNFDAVGSETNIAIQLTPKGTGNITFGTSAHLEFVSDSHGVVDAQGNELLLFVKASTAVNYLEITNAATGNNPSLAAQGSDTDIKLILSNKGTGANSGVVVQSGATSRLGFFGTTTALIQDITGARDETEGALAALLTGLAAYNIITDSTTAS